MRRLALLFLSIFLIGCIEEPEEIYHPVLFDRQVERLEAYYKQEFDFDYIIWYQYEDQETITRICGQPAEGCAIPQYSAIVTWTRFSEKCSLITHELLHFVLAKRKEVWYDHSNEVWEHYFNTFCPGEE